MNNGVLHYHWRRPRFIESAWLRRLSMFAVPAYLVAAGATLQIDLARIMEGIPRAVQIFSGAIPPDFAARGPMILDGFVESIQMTLIATVLGVLAGIPFGFLAAKNISPRPLYLLGRTLLIVARCLHPVVLGLVGAGGIGLLFHWAMESFRWSTVSFILITIVITALFGELITAMLRRRIL